MAKIGYYAKLVAAAIGAALQAGVLTLLPEQWKVYASIALAVLTAIGVYAVPNTQPDENAPSLGGPQLDDDQPAA